MKIFSVVSYSTTTPARLPSETSRLKNAVRSATRAALNGLEPDYVEVLDLGNARMLAAAARIGSTRLIDNVVLEGELR